MAFNIQSPFFLLYYAWLYVTVSVVDKLITLCLILAQWLCNVPIDRHQLTCWRYYCITKFVIFSKPAKGRVCYDQREDNDE